MKDSLILLSGGMDSVTLLYDKQHEIKKALFFRYGANHNEKELKYANFHCGKLGIPLIEISLDFMKEGFDGSILHGADGVKDGVCIESKKDSVVPFRNGIMLSIACGYAESNDMNKVLIANHTSESLTLPDCSKEFIESMNSAMMNGTYKKVKINAPYTQLKKFEIIKRGALIGVDYEETYSCYKGGDTHCGVCPACVERKEALRDAGIEDKTIYEQ